MNELEEEPFYFWNNRRTNNRIPYLTIFHILHFYLVKRFSGQNTRTMEIQLMLKFKEENCKNVT
jgi:hypothetical protein